VSLGNINKTFLPTGTVESLRMTNSSKLNALSIVAGVISLYFGLSLAAQLIVVTYSRWYILKSARELGLVVSARALPHLDIGQIVGLSIVSVTAFWFRSRLRRKMTIEQEKAQT
jgi:hypothetical protein